MIPILRKTRNSNSWVHSFNIYPNFYDLFNYKKVKSIWIWPISFIRKKTDFQFFSSFFQHMPKFSWSIWLKVSQKPSLLNIANLLYQGKPQFQFFSSFFQHMPQFSWSIWLKVSQKSLNIAKLLYQGKTAIPIFELIFSKSGIKGRYLSGLGDVCLGDKFPVI